MAKLFQKAGYDIVSGGKDSHIKLKKKGSPTIIILNHKEPRTGTEHALKKMLEANK